MAAPVLNKIRQGYWYAVSKLGFKPRAIQMQFADWIQLSHELGHPEEPVIEYMGMYIILIDGDDGRVRFLEHRLSRSRRKGDS